jgi:hypothetical protein
MSRPKTILYLQYLNPGAYPPLEYSSRMLADEGWEIFFLGAHSDGPEALELSPHPRIRCDVLPYTTPGWRQKVAYLRFLHRGFYLARKWKPDWIYVSDCLAAPVGVLLSKALRCKVIYHEHDSPAPGEATSWFMRLVLVARKFLARTAEFNILPQRERMRLFIAETRTKRPVY